MSMDIRSPLRKKKLRITMLRVMLSSRSILLALPPRLRSLAVIPAPTTPADQQDLKETSRVPSHQAPVQWEKAGFL